MSPRALVLALALAWPLQPLDDAARAWVQSARRPWLEAPMRFASDRARVVLIGGTAVALVSGAGGRAFVAEAALALVPVNLAVEGLKWTLWRTRPDGTRHRANSSFPSSHAANAFTLAAVLVRRWRRAWLPAGLAALIVAYSRLYLDRHWLTDVLGALPIALGGACLAAWSVSRWRLRKSIPRAG